MKLFIIIIFLVAIVAFVISRFLSSQKIIKQLRTDRNELIEQRGKQSDQLRQKGIEIDDLKKELDKYSGLEPKVALTSQEKQMILNALRMSEYTAWIEDPKTTHVLREIYRKLKEKIKESIKKG